MQGVAKKPHFLLFTVLYCTALHCTVYNQKPQKAPTKRRRGSVFARLAEVDTVTVKVGRAGQAIYGVQLNWGVTYSGYR